MTAMTITQVAENFNISSATIRYYERIGILSNIPRNQSGNRYFDSEALDWLEMVVCLRQSGVSVHVLQQYAILARQGDATINERAALLKDQKDDLLDQKKQLDRSIHRLEHKLRDFKNTKKTPAVGAYSTI